MQFLSICIRVNILKAAAAAVECPDSLRLGNLPQHGLSLSCLLCSGSRIVHDAMFCTLEMLICACVSSRGHSITDVRPSEVQQ